MATIGAKCFDTVNTFKSHYCKSNFSTTTLTYGLSKFLDF